ncbi:MAG TPA: carbamoyl-phosphate synthase large subunit [Streptosporangiaceae bacterium]|nr:carbamoyl-phosphate synthase large subunit [Streptosporangiaceae bacterium]
MTRRTDISHVLVIGSGPIRIGQACEFDYSGTQACRVLREEGLRVTLVNSNPATIMTDPEFADATYVEPITPESVEKVIEQERPDALLATLGGQTALNTAVALHERGVLTQHGVTMIGADIDAIKRGEDRQAFKHVVQAVGAQVPRSRLCQSMEQVRAAAADLGLPVVIRPSYTMGGLGSGLARTTEELEVLAPAGLASSPAAQVLVEQSVLGWKEYELELMRDTNDNVVVVCSIENLDPMGVHTGDSVTVAPAMTLTDREYQRMRDTGIAALRAVGVETGGCNIQFAVHPGSGEMLVIEMNPRVSRSSALASKATGFPIAKIAARLALGYTLDEIVNDITGETVACFEPALDYVAVKVPRFDFDKFPGADQVLTTTMKSIGEVMALGRSFTEALGKALRSAETTAVGFWTVPDPPNGTVGEALDALRAPHDGRVYTVERALRLGATVAQVSSASGIDPWFVEQIATLVTLRAELATAPSLGESLVRRAKSAGLSDRQIAVLRGGDQHEDEVRALRHRLGVRPVFKTVDTCAAEFAARTPYHYSAYELDPSAESEVTAQGDKPKVIILGSGPNRIGQGVEFDCTCVRAVMSLREAGFETIMVNCNPETVSTDYDMADRLYFEPLTLEDVLEVVHAEKQSGRLAGVIVQLGGQTPLCLAGSLKQAGVPIAGTAPEGIDLAEDRGAFGKVLADAGLAAPAYGTARSHAEAIAVADEIGYPVLVRPSYVLGGRGMEIARDQAALTGYISRAAAVSPEHPVLIDRFLDDATEVDTDALYDGEQLVIGAVLEHVEPAGVHSGDSACVLPPITLGAGLVAEARRATELIARHLGVRGLLNVQYAVKDGDLYVLEANPRAARTIPFICKATGVQLDKAAARVMLGASIASLREAGILPAGGDSAASSGTVAVKEAVLPFNRFRAREGGGLDPRLGPEMKSTGEVMGIDTSFGRAFIKAQAACYGGLPRPGRVIVCPADGDERELTGPLRRLADLGFDLLATSGHAESLRRGGVRCASLAGRPAEEVMADVSLVISTAKRCQYRAAASAAGRPCVTTVRAAAALALGLGELSDPARQDLSVVPLQAWHAC